MNIADIQAVVAARYKLPLIDMRSRRQGWPAAWARQVAMYLAREQTDLSLSQIGAAFDRHHATALWGVRVVASRLAVDPAVFKAVAALRQALDQLPATPAQSKAEAV